MLIIGYKMLKRRRDSESVAKQSPVVEINESREFVVTTSVLLRSEDADEYLLKHYEQRGLWLPFGNVDSDKTMRAAAEIIAIEVILSDQ